MDGCTQETLGYGYQEAALRLLIGKILLYFIIMLFIYMKIKNNTDTV